MYGVLFWPLHGFILDFWQKGTFLLIPFNHEGTTHWPNTFGWKKVPMRDYIFAENSFKFISCCFLIIKSTRFQLQQFNLEHLEITLTKLMFIRTTTT